MAVMLAAELRILESRCFDGISGDMCDMCHHEVVSLAKKPAEKAKATAVKASLTFASCSIRKSPIQMFLVADCFCPNVLLPGFFMWHRKHT